LKRKQYCIFNKEYSKEEYEKIVEKIKQQMKDISFTDIRGRDYGYGEFFPVEFSPFGYNETVANQYFIKNKDETTQDGYKWYDYEPNEYKCTILSKELPDEFGKFIDPFEQVIQCDCGRCFKIIEGELNILKKLNLSIPRQCPECRRLERFHKVLPPKFYDRVCDKCSIKIRTSYAPNQPEIVYCEKCYQQKVY
jgi:hypothetical protein